MQTFSTADLIDIAPHTPSCNIQFQRFGKRQSFYGRIRTVRCLRDNGLIKQIVNTAATGDVLVIDGQGSLDSALMGDQIAAAAMKNGWAGAIIYGAIRDCLLIDALDFGVKALGTNPKKSAKDNQGETDIVLHLGGVDFVPGHYVYSDADGILVSDKALIDD